MHGFGQFAAVLIERQPPQHSIHPCVDRIDIAVDPVRRDPTVGVGRKDHGARRRNLLETRHSKIHRHAPRFAGVRRARHQPALNHRQAEGQARCERSCAFSRAVRAVVGEEDHFEQGRGEKGAGWSSLVRKAAGGGQIWPRSLAGSRQQRESYCGFPDEPEGSKYFTAKVLSWAAIGVNYLNNFLLLSLSGRSSVPHRSRRPRVETGKISIHRSNEVGDLPRPPDAARLSREEVLLAKSECTTISPAMHIVLNFILGLLIILGPPWLGGSRGSRCPGKSLQQSGTAKVVLFQCREGFPQDFSENNRRDAETTVKPTKNIQLTAKCRSPIHHDKGSDMRAVSAGIKKKEHRDEPVIVSREGERDLIRNAANGCFGFGN